VTIIAIDTLVNLLDVEISSYLTTSDSKAEEDKKTGTEPGTKTDSVDSTAEVPSDSKKTSSDDNDGQDQPAKPEKLVQLAEEEKQVVDTVSILCRRLLPRLISCAHIFILSSLKNGDSETDASLTDVYDILLSVAGIKSAMFGISGNTILFANHLPGMLKEVLKFWSSSLLLGDANSTPDKNRKEALFSISLEAHFSAIAGYRPFDPSRSLKTAMLCLLKLSSQLQKLNPGENFNHLVAPLYTDAIGSFVLESKEEFSWGDEKALALDASKLLIVNCFRLICSPKLQDRDIYGGLLEDTLILFNYLLDCSSVWPALSLLYINDPPTGVVNV